MCVAVVHDVKQMRARRLPPEPPRVREEAADESEDTDLPDSVAEPADADVNEENTAVASSVDEVPS